MFRQVKGLRSELADPTSNAPSGDEALRKPLTLMNLKLEWDFTDKMARQVNTASHDKNKASAAFDTATELEQEAELASAGRESPLSDDSNSNLKSVDYNLANSPSVAFENDFTNKSAPSQVRLEAPTFVRDSLFKDFAPSELNHYRLVPVGSAMCCSRY